MPQAVIDSHAHVFSRDLPLAPGRRYAPNYDATLEQYLALLDQHQVAYGVLVQPSFLGTDNSYMLEALHKSAGRCVGVAVVDPACHLEELVALRAQRVKGIRLNLFGAGTVDLHQAHWQQLFAHIKALDMHVELHAPSSMLERYIAPIMANDVALVVDHFGRPAMDQPFQIDPLAYLLSLADNDRIFIKVSAIYRIFRQPQADSLNRLLSLFIRTFSSEKLMWGSDWPHTQHETEHRFSDSLNWALQHIQQPRDRQNILYRTAAAFYNIKGDDK
ncbi:putative TIM-barrel fold metal-dependent hydrolase [Advenella incenata]|uniref:Putative TIM-barrel fold metal-dependent hydrolase n=1 Tax=Advenella incenata TaxID=267800 RepID=A0A4Q7VS70_9BURK|nr:amidohydrolase family protein [Advenella incenata]RZT99309.1 putative TIM-barrel fold metal-dependent hydrolase [Advenella incenata]